SRVTGSALELGLGRPEKRVTARSKPCQNKCTGLVLPLNQLLNSSKTESDQSRIRPKRATASWSQDACSVSSRNGVFIGTPNGFSWIATSTPRLRSASCRAASKPATGKPPASEKDSAR